MKKKMSCLCFLFCLFLALIWKNNKNHLIYDCSLCIRHDKYIQKYRPNTVLIKIQDSFLSFPSSELQPFVFIFLEFTFSTVVSFIWLITISHVTNRNDRGSAALSIFRIKLAYWVRVSQAHTFLSILFFMTSLWVLTSKNRRILTLMQRL